MITSQTSLSALFHGILFAVALFVGFETVVALGEEAAMPRRSIPVAMIASIVVCACLYVLVSCAGAIGFGKGALSATSYPTVSEIWLRLLESRKRADAASLRGHPYTERG